MSDITEPKVLVYARLDEEQGVAMLKANSIRPDPLFSGYAVLRGVEGIKEQSHPLFSIDKIRLKVSMIDYVFEGVEQTIEDFMKIEENKKTKSEDEEKSHISDVDNSSFP